MANEHERDVVLTMARIVADYEHRRAGVENDLNQVRRDRVARARADWSSHPGGGRRCRRRRAPEHSDYAAATIPGADKIVMKGGAHLSLFAHPDAASVQTQVVARLR